MVHILTRHNAEFLSDGFGVLIEEAATLAPQKVLQWFEQCMTDTPARNTLTYLVINNGEFGLMAVDEYEQAYSDLSREEIRRHMNSTAETLELNPMLAQFQVYVGHETGIRNCDELCVFIPSSTEPALTKAIIGQVEQIAYQGMEQSHEPRMEGM